MYLEIIHTVDLCGCHVLEFLIKPDRETALRNVNTFQLSKFQNITQQDKPYSTAILSILGSDPGDMFLKLGLSQPQITEI